MPDLNDTFASGPYIHVHVVSLTFNCSRQALYVIIEAAISNRKTRIAVRNIGIMINVSSGN